MKGIEAEKASILMQEVWKHLKDTLTTTDDKSSPNILRQFVNGLLKFCQDKAPDEVNLCSGVSIYYKLIFMISC